MIFKGRGTENEGDLLLVDHKKKRVSEMLTEEIGEA